MFWHKNKLKIFTSIIGLGILIVLAIIYSKSKDDTSDLDTIVFLGNKNLAPIVYEDDGRAKGVAVDIVRALEDKIDFRVVVKALDWVEAQDMVLSGQADALVQINPSPEREELFDFTDELLESEFSIFTDSANTHIRRVEDLINMSVGVEKGGYPQTLLREYGGIKLVEIPSISSGFHMIKAGNLDALVVDRWIGEYELAMGDFKSIQLVGQPVESQYSKIAVKKGNIELLKIINNGLRELKDDSTINDIIRAWKGKQVLYFTEEMLVRLALYISIGVIIIILLIGFALVDRYKRLSKKLQLDVEERSMELEKANELLRKANMELERISMIDKLTNLYNRRFFDISFSKVWSQAKREGLPLSLIMIDIDHFKKYNDNYGHLAGDGCLSSIAKVIKETVKRGGDFVARYGGEEFVVLLPNTSLDGARIVAENIRQSVEGSRYPYQGINTRVTVSLGVASIMPGSSSNPNDLIYAADEALYKAKESGRNRVVAYGNNLDN